MLKSEKKVMGWLYGIHCPDCGSSEVEVYNSDSCFYYCKCNKCEKQFDIRRDDVCEGM